MRAISLIAGMMLRPLAWVTARHRVQQLLTAAPAAGNLPEKLERLLAGRLAQRRQADIEALYTQWSAEDGATAEEQRAIFREELKWQAAYDDGCAATLLQFALWMDMAGVDLCRELYGADS